MDISKIFEKANVTYERAKVPNLFKKAIFESERSDRSMSRIFEQYNRIIQDHYEINPSFMEYLMDAVFHPDVVDYMTQEILSGRSKEEILSEGFVASRPVYDRLPDKSEFSDVINEIFPNIKISEAFNLSYQGELLGSVPGDEEIGDVSFHAQYTTVKTREQRIKELYKLKYYMENKPRPEMLYIAMTQKQARETTQVNGITGLVIAHDYAVTYDMDKHILGVCWNGQNFEPLVSHMIKSDKYPEQLFTDEFEQWYEQLGTMWVAKGLPTDYIMYYIDLWTDSFWHEGFLRRWNRAGGGGAAVEAIQTKVTKKPRSTEIDEFFVDDEYRVDPGSYDGILTEGITNNFTINPKTNAGHLITVFNPNTRFGCLKYNRNFTGAQTHYRIYRSQPGRPKSNAYIFLKGCSEKINENHLNNGNLKIDIKIPGVTGWMDCLKPFVERNFRGTDGEGIFLSYERFGEGVLELTFGPFSNAFAERQAIVRTIFLNESVPSIERFSFLNWRNLYSGNTNP